VLIMKTKNLQSLFLAIAAGAALAFTAGNVAAQDSTATTAQPAAASQPAPQLSYGVPQVLQLEQAKISDGVIVSYIQNSGTIYSLKADEIVYLKQQGVSDNVLNAMLNQRSRLTGSTEPATTTASPTTASTQTYAPAAPAPTVTYDQPTAPPSTVYVIPDTQTYQYDTYYYSAYPYYSYPYYGGYYGWPGVSLSFGWGGYYGGGYRGGGGFRGGGGGFHDGGGGLRGGGGGVRGGGGGIRGGGGGGGGGGFRGGGGGRR
jgi:hypothetical protein